MIIKQNGTIKQNGKTKRNNIVKKGLSRKFLPFRNKKIRTKRDEKNKGCSYFPHLFLFY